MLQERVGLAVDEDGAGAAAALAAAVLAAGQVEVVAEDAEQGAFRVGVEGVSGAVDVEQFDVGHEGDPQRKRRKARWGIDREYTAEEVIER